MRRGFLNQPAARKKQQKQDFTPAASNEPSKAVVDDVPLPRGVPAIAPDVTLSPSIAAPSIKIPTGPAIEVYDVPHHSIIFKEYTRRVEQSNLDYVITLLPILPAFSLEAPTTCLLFTGVKEAILALPGFPTSYDYNAPWRYTRVADVPGVGKGLFASVSRQPGDILLTERPLVVMPKAIPIINDGRNLGQTIINYVVDRILPPGDSQYRALSNCKPNEPNPLKGIMETNALPIGSLPGLMTQDWLGVAAIASRINHSCAPNACVSWDLDSFTFSVRALRPIAAGEQVTISYLGWPLDSRAKRRAELLAKYSFTCTCPTCSLPKSESARSDIRRNIVSALQPKFHLTTATRPPTEVADAAAYYAKIDAELKAWVEDPSLPDDYIIKECVRYVEMLDAETWFCEKVWPGLLQKLVKACCAIEDVDGARKWAERAAVLAKTMTPKGTDLGWSQVAMHPEKSDWWGLRTKRKAAPLKDSSV